MGRSCSDCGFYRSCSEYSRNQWMKGDGWSRCRSCVDGRPVCRHCGRAFGHPNELKMHMQTHRPRNVACPICGERRFRSGANAVQHVESGYCSGCLGRENARRQIYEFASRKSAMRPYMSDVPMLTYDGSGRTVVPDYPYTCRECGKAFRQASQLLQHQDQKHDNRRLLGY